MGEQTKARRSSRPPLEFEQKRAGRVDPYPRRLPSFLPFLFPSPLFLLLSFRILSTSRMIRKNESSSTALSKRARVEDEDDTPTLTVAIGSTSSGGKPEAGALIRTVKRTSGLEAPIVSLSGAHGVSTRFYTFIYDREKES